MILLDSNIIIYLSKGLFDIDVLDDDEVYAVSVITYMEVLGFPFTSEKEERFIQTLLGLFEVIYIDEAIVAHVIMLKKKYKLRLPDAIICATALVRKAELYTNDLRLKVIEEVDIRTLG